MNKRLLAVLLSVASGLSLGVASAQSMNSGPGGINFDIAAKVDPASKNFRTKDGVLTIAIVTHTAGNGFFNPSYVGATAAANEFSKSGIPVKLLRLGSASASDDIPAELAILRQVIADPKLDGLAMTTPQVGAYKDIVNKAFELGIPVATFNSFDPSLPRRSQISHTGQDASAAAIAGEAIVGDLVKRGVKSGTIVMLNDTTAGNQEVNNRIKFAAQAARDAIKEAGLSGVKVDDGQGLGVQVTNGKVDDIINVLQSTPNVVGAFGPNGAITPDLGKAIGTLKLNGKLSAFGFDLGPAQLKAIEDGALTGSLGQQPFIQGYWPIKQIVLQIDRGISAANVDTRAELVTKANLASFKKYVQTRFTN